MITNLRTFFSAYRVLTLLALATCLAASCQFFSCNKKSEIFNSGISPSDESSYVLLFSSNIQGYLEPCGCTANPLGGVSRLASVVESTKVNFDNRSMYLDGGNLLTPHAKELSGTDLCLLDSASSILLETLKTLDCSGTIYGPYDFPKGYEWTQKTYSNFGIPVFGKAYVSGDLQAPETSLKFDIGTGFVGIIGVSLVDSTTTANDARNYLASKSEELSKSGARAVIAFVASAPGRLDELLEHQRYIDVAILGDVQDSPSLPKKIDGGPWLIRNGSRGQYLGALEFGNLNAEGHRLAFDATKVKFERERELLRSRLSSLQEKYEIEADEGKKKFFNQRIQLVQEQLEKARSPLNPPEKPYIVLHSIPLSRKIAPQEKLMRAVKKYDEDSPKLTLACEHTKLCPKLEDGKASYVGAISCKNCHLEAYTFWQAATFKESFVDMEGKKAVREVGHSKAWSTLVEAGKAQDVACIGCHSVGFEKPGGYCKINEVKPFKNVQCESCHGPGSKHIETANPRFIKRKVGEESCRTCHHVPHIESFESFNYQEKLLKILGPGHGEKLYKTLKHEKLTH